MMKIRDLTVVVFCCSVFALALGACDDDDNLFTVVKPGEDVIPAADPPSLPRADTLTQIVVDGQVDCSNYAALAGGTPEDIWDYKLGPTAAYFQGSGAELEHVPMGPEDGKYCHRDCRTQAVDWAGNAGQTLFLTDGEPGMDRTRFDWSRHEGHGGAQYNHLYLLAPINTSSPDDGDSWYTAAPDPVFGQEAWLETGPLTTPTAIARGRVLWNNNALVGFKSGLVGAVGTGNSGDEYPFVMLEGRVPMAIAITPNNELAFVATWNSANCQSELAVLALKSKNDFPYMLPSFGFFSEITLLGYVELPIAAPTSIAATVDLSQWTWPQSTDLTDPDERQRWIDREIDHQVARAGYVVVASRDENTVVWVDITPTLTWIESMYFGSEGDFTTTQNSGWPLTFQEAPLAKPVVVHSEVVELPTVVVAGYDVGDRAYLGRDKLFSQYSYVATFHGDLVTFDSTGLMSGAGSVPSLSSTYSLCNNPTDVAYGAGMPLRDEMLFTCRGDRKFVVVGPDGVVQRTLADDRVGDPVAGMITSTRSANVLTVADYKEHRLLNYQDGPLRPWGDEIFSNQPEPGGFVFLGVLELGGPAVAISAAQVP